mgnify:CR=1 FL=1
MPSEMRRLKYLEEENQRLKRIVADLSLDKELLQEVVRKSFKPGAPTRRLQMRSGQWILYMITFSMVVKSVV